MPEKLKIGSTGLHIDLSEVEQRAIRASGPGGQHVNKTSSAIQLSFDIKASSLPAAVKERLLRLHKGGQIIIKAQNSRSQQQNRQEALQRLVALLSAASQRPKRRIATRPSRRAKQKRLDSKNKRSRLKDSRRRIYE